MKISEESESKKPFTDDFNEEQKVLIRTQSDLSIDKAMPKKYNEVIEKAKFLVKLAVP